MFIARSTITLLFAVVVGGCATLELARDELYPADWPDIVGVGDFCGGIDGTFANHGSLVDASRRKQEVLLTDLLAPYLARDKEKVVARRACERVSVDVDFYAPSGDAKVGLARLVLKPSREVSTAERSRIEPCESMALPRGKGYPFHSDPEAASYETGAGFCKEDAFLYVLPGGTSQVNWLIGVGSDGSLVVRMEANDVYWIPYLIPIIHQGVTWARFRRLP